MSHVPFGYHGRYLRVDLTSGVAVPMTIHADTLRHYLGGVGLGTWLLLQESEPQQSPLSPESPLVFVFSPLVGSPFTTSAKFAVVSQSPLTGRINDSLSSSHFAIAGKKTGYDAIVIVGKFETLSCLVITDEGIQIRNAENARGKTVSQTTDYLRAELGARFQTAVIGPAGERLARFATISHDGRHAGRGGAGAVMGSKNMKAIAVTGTKTVTSAFPDRLTAYAKELSKKSLGPETAKYRELGTVSNLRVFNRLGILPTRNFQQSTFDAADTISPESFSTTRTRTRKSCAACNIGCEHVFQIEPENLPAESGKPQPAVRMEYESLFALGSLCGISDPQTILQAAARCDELGIDSISTGATIAFAMECSEKGFLPESTLQFGESDSLLHTIENIGSREGLGDLLSQGTRIAAESIGHSAAEFAPHIKGLELPGYEPRALQTMALGLAVNTRGADHNRSGAYQVDLSENGNQTSIGPEEVLAAVETEDEAAVMDSLIICKFLRGVFDDRFAGMAEMLSLVTGWNVTPEELHRTAKRIVTAKKWFNIQQGWQPEEDSLPERFFTQPLPDGPSHGETLDRKQFALLIHEYNKRRGWTEDGWIPDQLLTDLEIPSHSLIS